MSACLSLSIVQTTLRGRRHEPCRRSCGAKVLEKKKEHVPTKHGEFSEFQQQTVRLPEVMEYKTTGTNTGGWKRDMTNAGCDSIPRELEQYVSVPADQTHPIPISIDLHPSPHSARRRLAPHR